MTKYSKFTLLALAMALALFAVAGPSQAAIQTAGSLVINLDAEALSAGAFTSWTNAGTAAGAFTVDPTSPEPGNITVVQQNKGQSGVNKKVVYANNLGIDNRNPGNALVWSKTTDDLFGVGARSSFSVEMWVYDDAFTAYEGLMGWSRRDGGDDWISFWTGGLGGGDAGTGRLWYGTNWATGNSDFLGASTRQDPTGGKFNHYTFVYDKALGGMKVYLNGKLAVSSAVKPPPGILLLAAAPVHVFGYGRTNPQVGGCCTAGIAKLRVHTGTLSAGQVYGNFITEAPDYILTANTPAPPDPETAGSLVIKLDADTLAGAVGSDVASWPNTASGAVGNFVTWEGGTFVSKPKLETITAGLSAVAKKVVRFYPSLAARDGNNSVLKWDQTAPASITGTGSFSAEGWVYQDAVLQLGQTWFGWGDRNDTSAIGVGCGISNSWAMGGGYPTDPTDFISTDIPDPVGTGVFPVWNAGNPTGIGKFYYYAFVYDSVNSKLSLYINGKVNRDLNVSRYERALDSNVVVGAWSRGASGGYSFEGAVAKVRVHSGALTRNQVKYNYNLEGPDYIPDFTQSSFEAPVFGENRADVEFGRASTWGPPVLANRNALQGDPTWALVSPPAGMTIDPATGIISWTNPSPLGETLVTVTAETPDGKTEGTVTMNVLPAPALPVVVPYPADIIALDAGTLSYGGSPTSWVNYASNAALVGNFTAESTKLSVVQVENSTARAVVFDGTNQAALKSANVAPSEITGNHAWTVELWLNSALAADERWAFAWGHRWGPDNTCACLGYGSNGTWGAFGGWGAGDMGYAGGTLPQLNAWHHVVLTYAGGTDGNLTLYVDAAQNNQQTKTLNTHGPDDGETIPVFVGGSYDGPDWLSAATSNFLPFTGMISRVRVHSVELSAGQVAANYAAEKPDFSSLGSFALTKPEFFNMLVFWDVAAGETSPGQDFAFRNDGDGDLTVTGVQVNGEYVTVPALTPPIMVPGHTEYAVSVAAAPATAGSQEGSLVLSYTNGDLPGTYTLNLLTNPSSAYVSTTGSDTTGNGLEAAPFRTIQKAVDVGRNIGASIKVLAGSYASFAVPGTADTFVRIAAPAGGVTVADGPVNFAAAADKTVIVEITGLNFVPTSAAAPTDPIIQINGDGMLVLSIDGATVSSANLGTKSPTLVGAAGTSSCDLDLTLTDCVLNGADVSNGVWVQYGTSADITILRSSINHTDNAVIRNVTGTLLIQESTIDTTIGKAVYAGGFLPGNLDPGAWWWASNGPVTLDRCYIVNIGGVYNASVSPDITLSAVFLFTDVGGRDTVTNCVFEGCNAGIQGGWTWDTSFMHVFNNTFIAHTGLTSVGTGVFDDADHFGYLAYNNVVLGFATSISAWDPLTLSNNFDEVAQAGPPELNPNFKYQSGAAYALPTGIVGVTGFIPVAPSALTGAGVYAAGVPRVDYYGGARSFSAPYIGAFEGLWSAPAIQAITTQIAVLGRPFSTLTPTLTAGYPPSTWTLNAAAITAGMTVDSATGVVSWANPGPVGQYPVILTATNAVGAGTVSFTVKVLSQPPAAATYWYLFE